ncbi:methyltransferase domain-containing protein [Bradyrhizobium sp. 159]|nr:methyltransferase domain-containing protein [Bradyrhizobium sp. 159]
MLDRYEAYNLAQPFSEEDPFTAERYEQFHRHMPKRSGLAVLDVGAGPGRGGTRLAELDPSYQLCALDVVQSRLDRLPACYGRTIHGSSTHVPADDCSFDVVVAGEFIEHLYPSDVDPSLCEFQRVLKVGGRLMLTTPNPASLKRWYKGGTVYTVSHLSQHWPKEMRIRLRMHGFSSVRILGSGKAIRHFGGCFPIFSVYGSYLVIADKI